MPRLRTCGAIGAEYAAALRGDWRAPDERERIPRLYRGRAVRSGTGRPQAIETGIAVRIRTATGRGRRPWCVDKSL